jgi:hypothetical protein
MKIKFIGLIFLISISSLLKAQIERKEDNETVCYLDNNFKAEYHKKTKEYFAYYKDQRLINRDHNVTLQENDKCTFLIMARAYWEQEENKKDKKTRRSTI